MPDDRSANIENSFLTSQLAQFPVDAPVRVTDGGYDYDPVSVYEEGGVVWIDIEPRQQEHRKD